MYSLETPLSAVKGIGPKLTQELHATELHTVQDLLLEVPLRYIDYSEFRSIAEAEEGAAVTIQAVVDTVSQFRKGKKVMTRAQISDETGKMSLWWFNTTFIKQSLKKGKTYLFSGVMGKKQSMVHPLYEAVHGADASHSDGSDLSDTTSELDTVHTGRLVPVYSSRIPVKTGTLRRICKEITDHLVIAEDAVSELLAERLPDRVETFKELHFPESEEGVVAARERLALEEFFSLMRVSQEIKAAWKKTAQISATELHEPVIPELPFELTGAQERVIGEICSDLKESVAMNRLLLGDVGSGKTIVAGIAARQIILSCNSVAFIAPTKILAEQHSQTIQKLLPDLPVRLVQAGQKISETEATEPQLWIGTHAVLNRLELIKPALIIYDEQHRFGVSHRSSASKIGQQPHVLTMTATPIPRTLILTLFSHLSVSVIDELPANRVPTKTWVLPQSKHDDMLQWLTEQIRESNHTFQALVVCPFIAASEAEGLAHVASAIETYEELKTQLSSDITIGLLHGKQSNREKDETISALFAGNIDILVTTTIVEVGIDLPQASAMLIESAERYGLASLHQLRGRVGRAGQQGYCALFASKSGQAKERLKLFSETLNGQKLAELDLQNRGAGELFGTAQSGFGSLRFANWANLELVGLAQRIFPSLPTEWVSLITIETPQETPSAN